MLVHDAKNEHPMAVPNSMALAESNDTQSPGDKNAERKVNFLLCPDFKATTAVAASSSSAVCGGSYAAHDAAVPRLVLGRTENYKRCVATREISIYESNESIERESEIAAVRLPIRDPYAPLSEHR